MSAGPVLHTELAVTDGLAHVCFSMRSDGDFRIDRDQEALERTRRSFVDLPWSQPDEVHGTTVIAVDVPSGGDGVTADALTTDRASVVLGIWVGDCAPVAFVSASGRLGAAHAGWRGLADGILDRTVEAVRAGLDGDDTISAVLGPCIHPCCYEFGEDDLSSMVARFGTAARSVTSSGAAALDVPGAVRTALGRHGIDMIDRSWCTGCHADRSFSHRVRQERERHVMAVWKDPRP